MMDILTDENFVSCDEGHQLHDISNAVDLAPQICVTL